MQDFKTTALVSTPSYALLIGDTLRETGIPLSALSLKWGLFGAEPWSDAMRQEIEDRLGIVATDNYGLSEVIGPGVSGECLERNGLHISEDHFIVEVVDPETLQPVPPGERGRTGPHHAHQGGVPHDPVPDGGPDPHCCPTAAPAAGRAAG